MKGRNQLIGSATYVLGSYLVRRAVRKRVNELLGIRPSRTRRLLVPLAGVAAVGAAAGAFALMTRPRR